jgi:hypothetical protein
MDWVEQGTVPDNLSLGVTTSPFVPKLCPFPQEAIWNKAGATNDPSSYTCGGDLQTNQTICHGLRTLYKYETADDLQAYGEYNPATCKVGCADIAIVKASFGKRSGQPGFDPRADVNNDGVVDVRDLAFVSKQLPAGTRCP